MGFDQFFCSCYGFQTFVVLKGFNLLYRLWVLLYILWVQSICSTKKVRCICYDCNPFLAILSSPQISLSRYPQLWQAIPSYSKLTLAIPRYPQLYLALSSYPHLFLAIPRYPQISIAIPSYPQLSSLTYLINYM